MDFHLIAGEVGAPVLLVNDGDVAIAVTGVKAKPDSVRLTIETHRRRPRTLDIENMPFGPVVTLDGQALEALGGEAGGFVERNEFMGDLPGEGPLDLVVHFPYGEAPDARGTLDGAAIQAAARRAIELWPDEPLEGGWFTSPE